MCAIKTAINKIGSEKHYTMVANAKTFVQCATLKAEAA